MGYEVVGENPIISAVGKMAVRKKMRYEVVGKIRSDRLWGKFDNIGYGKKATNLYLIFH
jgi:hypothetical protein